MSLCEKIKNKSERIALVGLGYVGMPIAVEFSKHVDVIGFYPTPSKILITLFTIVISFLAQKFYTFK